MEYHIVLENDLDLLAEWNHQLIQDEGHRNPMTVSLLRERMKEWIAGEYTAILFSQIGEPVAYALFRENEKEIYLQQLFVRRDKRNKFSGRKKPRR